MTGVGPAEISLGSWRHTARRHLHDFIFNNITYILQKSKALQAAFCIILDFLRTNIALRDACANTEAGRTGKSGPPCPDIKEGKAQDLFLSAFIL